MTIARTLHHSSITDKSTETGSSVQQTLVEKIAAAASAALYSAAYEGLQQPTTSVSQICDHFAGSNFAEKTKFISPPPAARFGTIQWHAEQLGGAVGQLLPFLVSRVLLKSFFREGTAAAEEVGVLSKTAPIGLSLKEAAATGFVSQALFRPTDNDTSFWSQRVMNGGNGAITMTALTASTFGLNKLAGSKAALSFKALRVLRNPIANGIVSGAGAGFLGSELNSVEFKRQFASTDEIEQSMYGSVFLGGVLGAVAQYHISNAKVKEVRTVQESEKVTAPPSQLLLPMDMPIKLAPQTESHISMRTLPETSSAAAAELTETQAPRQYEINFPDPLTPLGQKAWKLLRQLEDTPPEKSIKPGVGESPISVDELQAMHVLKDDWLDGARRMYWKLSDRSTQAHYMVSDGWHLESASAVKQNFAKLVEKSLLYSNEANIFDQRDGFVGINKHPEEIGLKNEEEARAFIELFHRTKPFSPWLWNPVDVDPVALFKMSKWSAVDQIPDHALRGITQHFRRAKQNPDDTEHDIGKLIEAAPGWDVIPSAPIDLATSIGKLSPREKVASQLAFQMAVKDIDAPDLSPFEKFTGEHSAAARAAYAKYFDQSVNANTRLLVKRLTVKFGIPNAVDALTGDRLTSEQQREVVIGLNKFNSPYPLLATIDVPTYFEAFNKLVEKYPMENDAATHHYFGWQNRTALVLTSLFKKNWQNWLDVQERAGRTASQATDFLFAQEPASVKGLAQFLLQHGRKGQDQLGQIADHWSKIQTSEAADYQEVLKTALRARFKNISNERFAEEASRWAVSKSQYPSMEERYQASLAVPSPFPLDRTWTSGSLTGRFIPRDDPRGLFLGEYSNCCQHPGGTAESSAWYGQENPKSGFFVVENADREIVAQSWAIATDNGGLIFDNVEAKGIDRRQSAVAEIYSKAAQSLLTQFHTVTMGTEHSDLDLAGFKPAGPKSLTVPTDFSGYTDSKSQVLLASTKAIPPKPVPFSTVRGATNLDKLSLARISQERLPEGWQHLPWARHTRGLIVQSPDDEIMGYALFEPANRHISDLAVKPSAQSKYAMTLTSTLLKEIRTLGGDWTADMQSSAPYRLIQKAAKFGRLQIISDQLKDTPLGLDQMHHVTFTVSSTPKAPGDSPLQATVPPAAKQ
jgi:hypothetical protein